MNDQNQEFLGRKNCKVEIEVLHDVAKQYAQAVEAENNETMAEAGSLVMAANDVIYKKLVSECGFDFDSAEKLVQTLNLEALKAAHEQQK